MSDTALGILKGCLIAVLYLFVARVVWTVRAELRTRPVADGPPEAPPARRSRRERAAPPPATAVPVVAGWQLVIVAPPARAGEGYLVDREVTIGRGGGCTIALAGDTFVSTVHARVHPADAAAVLEDLGSTNGTRVNGTRISAPYRLRAGDRVQIGDAELEARR